MSWTATLAQWVRDGWPESTTVELTKATSHTDESTQTVIATSPILGRRTLQGGGESVKVRFTSLTNSYNLKRIDLWATRSDTGTEVVFASYVNSGTQTIPSSNTDPDFMLQVWCSFQLASGQTITINPIQGEFITDQELEEAIEDLSDVYMKKGTDYVTAGQVSSITPGVKATAEGSGTDASGESSHAEGIGTSALQAAAHAEGLYTSASGAYSHAEGSYSEAGAENAHAEGVSTIAQANNAHAEGMLTQANGRSQHVFGEYNIPDYYNTLVPTERGKYVEIVGNGTANNAKSNARTLDWSGNEVLSGKLTVGAGPTNNMDVATKQYVDAAPTITIINYTTASEELWDAIDTAYNAGKDVYIKYTSAVSGLTTILYCRLIAYYSHIMGGTDPYYQYQFDGIWSSNMIQQLILTKQTYTNVVPGSPSVEYSWETNQFGILIAPSYSGLANGTYKLQMTYSSGRPTFSWVADS